MDQDDRSPAGFVLPTTMDRTSPSMWLLPFHDQKIWRPAIAAHFRFAGTHRLRLVEVAKLEAGCQQKCHVGLERSVPVADPDPIPFDPLLAFIEVVIDVESSRPIAFVSPSGRRASCVKALKVCDQERAAGP